MASIPGFIAGQSGPSNARVPIGIYALVQLDGAIGAPQNAAYPGTPPAYPDPATDTVLVGYFTTLLNNPGVSRIDPEIGWRLLNPGNSGPDASEPVEGAYTWNSMDDLFTAVDQRNTAHPTLPPKTIQISPSAGFNSPSWALAILTTASAEGARTGVGSCDGLNPLAQTQGFATPLSGSSNPMSRVLGGMEFSHSFSSSNVNGNGSTGGMSDIQPEGCPGFLQALCKGPEWDAGVILAHRSARKCSQHQLFSRHGCRTVLLRIYGSVGLRMRIHEFDLLQFM
jgi:hypothetical protein